MPEHPTYLAVIAKHSNDVVGVCFFDQIGSIEKVSAHPCYVRITSTEFNTYATEWGKGPINPQRAGIIKRQRYTAKPVQSFELVPT